MCNWHKPTRRGRLLAALSLAYFFTLTLLIPPFWDPATAQAFDANLRLWSQATGIKVRPTTPVVTTSSISVKGAKNESVSFQVILTGATAYSNLDVNLTNFQGPNGVVLGAGSAQLYRVGYLNITTPTDKAGSSGEWPDILYPIGADRYDGQLRNGAPFNLTANRNQPIWVSLDLPKTAQAGNYTASFNVVQAQSGIVLQTIPINLTIWNFTLPDTSSVTTAYGYASWGAYCYHYFGYNNADCVWDGAKETELARRYQAEALAHRMTISGVANAPTYTYSPTTKTITSINWSAWDATYSKPGITSYPIPGPKFRWNDPAHIWTQAETEEAVALWREVAAHYRAKGWFNKAYLYTKDEPATTADNNLVNLQAATLHTADPAFSALVTSEYDPAIKAQINIWTPVVNFLEKGSGFASTYGPERAAGKKIWWYDSNMSGLPIPPYDSWDPVQVPVDKYGNWPDEIIDHQGVNQLVHGFMHYRYGMDGYLYYETANNYKKGSNIFVSNYSPDFRTNGDGTLFYPGIPSVIGGVATASTTAHIPLPSLRLKLLQRSWNTYDYMTLLAAQDASFVNQVVNGIVTNNTTWSHDPIAYENAREQLGGRLHALASQGQLTLITPLALSNSAPHQAETVAASFTVKNTGGQTLVIPVLVASARDSNGANVDFPALYNISLASGQSYTYNQVRTFASQGNHSTQIAYYLNNTWQALGSPVSFYVQPSLGRLSLDTPLTVSNRYPKVGELVTANFTVRNTGTGPMIVPMLVAAVRSPAGANWDFPAAQNILLQPGQTYTYNFSRSFANTGTHTSWPSFYMSGTWTALSGQLTFSVGYSDM